MATPEFFNPAGLDLLEGPAGAISYGFIAPRVLYSRFVGSLSAELGDRYVHRLDAVLRGVSACAYFSDASALRDYDCSARVRFLSFVLKNRSKLASLVTLTWAEGVSPAARQFATSVGEAVTIVSDPVEFDRLLSNVAPAPRRRARQWEDAFPHEPPSAFR